MHPSTHVDAYIETQGACFIYAHTVIRQLLELYWAYRQNEEQDTHTYTYILPMSLHINTHKPTNKQKALWLWKLKTTFD